MVRKCPIVCSGWTARRGVVIHLNARRKKSWLHIFGTVLTTSVQAAASDGLDLLRFDKHPILARTLANLCRRTAPARSASETQAKMMCASSKPHDSTHHPQHPCFRWPALAISLDDANSHLQKVDASTARSVFSLGHVASIDHDQRMERIQTHYNDQRGRSTSKDTDAIHFVCQTREQFAMVPNDSIVDSVAAPVISAQGPAVHEAVLKSTQISREYTENYNSTAR